MRSWLAATGGALAATLAHTALAVAQTAGASSTTAQSAGDPLNALWSLLGSSTVAGVLYLWIRAEKNDRHEERTERRSAMASKDALMAKMVELFEADIEHKVSLRERLKGQDEALDKMLEVLTRIDRRVEERRPSRRGEAGG